MKSLPFFRSSVLVLATAILCTSCGNVSGLKVGNFDVMKTLKVAEDTHNAIAPLSEADEISLGEGIASNLLGLAPLLNDREVQAYVNRVGRWLSMHSERPDLPWTFAVIDSDEVNAFAAPGGYIVITKGMLLKMRSEAELAGVLGHEIAHVLRKHHLTAMQTANARSAFKGGLSLIGSAKNYSPTVLNLLSGGTEIYSRSLDKEDEFESDRMGVVLAARAGYDPFGLPAMLLTLQSINNKDPGMQLLFQTHPKLSDRLNELDKVMGKDFERFDNLPNAQARFSKVTARLNSKK